MKKITLIILIGMFYLIFAEPTILAGDSIVKSVIGTYDSVEELDPNYKTDDSVEEVVFGNKTDDSDGEIVFGYKTDDSDGEIVFSYKTDFASLSSFLNISETKYFQLRKDKSMLEIAELQGISEEELLNYITLKNFEALETAYINGEVDLYFVMTYALYLKDDLNWEINAKRQ
ncbi:hypothetical protein NSQ43_13010 [Sporosarcina sp. FSL W8-0480]|uniref:hypothetical protein n=1 Tax=Sporosarcina sp. FSL W8-0480 TaxID=2954701 RepID=UPI0030D746CA